MSSICFFAARRPSAWLTASAVTAVLLGAPASPAAAQDEACPADHL